MDKKLTDARQYLRSELETCKIYGLCSSLQMPHISAALACAHDTPQDNQPQLRQMLVPRMYLEHSPTPQCPIHAHIAKKPGLNRPKSRVIKKSKIEWQALTLEIYEAYPENGRARVLAVAPGRHGDNGRRELTAGGGSHEQAR